MRGWTRRCYRADAGAGTAFGAGDGTASGAAGRSTWCIAWLLTVVALGVTQPASAQSPAWLFPDRSLMPDLIAGARDPVVKGQLVYSITDPTLFGPAFAGDVALAGTLPVLLLAGDPAAGNALVAGMEGAIFARFSFRVVERELVNTDWIFAVPLIWHRGAHWLRLRYYHTSSHLGDEYAQRFEQSATTFSRDGGDLTAFVRPRPGLGLYGLVFLSANSHPAGSHGAHVRAGIEVDTGERRPGSVFAAADVRLDRSTDWTPRLSSQAGIWLPPAAGRPLRLALEVLTGPTAMGQFHGEHTTHLGLGLFWNP